MRLRPPDRLVLCAAVLALLVPGWSARTHRPDPQRAEPISVRSALRGIESIDRIGLGVDRASRAAQRARELHVRPAPGAITGWYGEARRGHFHPGVDIDGETGDPVVAAALGTVVHAGPPIKGYTGYGDLVVIDHGAYETVYAHLSRIDVAVGDVVPAGIEIGAIGRTGNATGSHLHFEVRIDGKTVDPGIIFNFF